MKPKTQPEEAYSPEINNLLTSLWDYENANGDVPPSDLRNFAEFAGKQLGRIKKEREILIYWLLQSYRTLSRQGFGEGLSDDECRSALVSVLANIGYEPNESAAAEKLLKREEAYHIDHDIKGWE